MNAQLADLTLTSISAYRKFHVNDNNDTDLVPINIVNINSADQNQQQFTQELRLTSPATDRLSYVVGFFYFNQTVGTVTHLRGTGNLVLAPGAYAANDINRSITSKSESGFGQAQLRLTDRLRLIGGLRYTNDDYNAWFFRTVPTGAVGAFPILGGPAFNAPSLTANDNNVSYRGGLQFDFAPDVMGYATYTTGYKGSALNMLNNLSQALVSSGAYKLRPEKASNAEVGLRSAFFDRKLSLNVTGYYEEVRDFQAQTFDNVLNTFALENAGKLRADGAELETVFAPNRQLSFSGNVAYTRTRIEGLIIGCYPGQSAAQGCTGGRQDVTGSALANSPLWAFSLTGNYTKPLGSLPANLFADATYSYRSSVFFNYRDPNTVQPGYGVVNVALGIEHPDRRYRVSVFARNLFNKHYATVIATGFLDTSATGAGYTQLLTNDAWRTVGVELSTEF
jgi:iron complex outermembrane receptor protein